MDMENRKIITERLKGNKTAEEIIDLSRAILKGEMSLTKLRNILAFTHNICISVSTANLIIGELESEVSEWYTQKNNYVG